LKVILGHLQILSVVILALSIIKFSLHHINFVTNNLWVACCAFWRWYHWLHKFVGCSFLTASLMLILMLCQLHLSIFIITWWVSTS